MAENEIPIKIDLDTKDAEKSLKNFEGAAKSTASGVDKAFTALKFAAGAAVAVFAGKALIGGLEDVIAAAEESDKAVRGLGVALAATGEFSEAAIKEFEAYAAEIQRTTTLQDEQVLSSLKLAKTFDLTNEQAKKVTEAAIGLAAATGEDLNSATEKLAKTFSGQEGLLGKQVRELKGLTEEQLRNGAALDIVIGKYGEFAQAQAKTFGGAVTQARNQFGEIFESIGKIITQNPVIIATINALGQAFGKIAKVIGDNQETIASYASSFVKFVVGLVPPTLKFASGVVTAVQAVISILGLLAKAVFGINDVFETIFSPLRRVVLVTFEAIVVAIASAVEGLIEIAKIVPGAEKAFAGFGINLDNASKAVKNLGGKAFEDLKTGANGLNTAIVQTNKAVKEGLIAGLETAAKTTGKFGDAIDGVLPSIESEVTAIQGIDKNVQSATEGLKNGAKATKDFADQSKELEKVKGSFDKILKASEQLTKENEKRTLSAEQLAAAEFKRAQELAASAEKELKLTGKLNAENQKSIQIFLAQAKAAGELAIKQAELEKVKGSFDNVKKASEDITKELQKQTLSVVELAAEDQKRAFALIANAEKELQLRGNVTKAEQDIIAAYKAQASEIVKLAENQARLEKVKGSFDNIKKGAEELTKEFEKQDQTQLQLIETEFERAKAAAESARIELQLSGKLNADNQKLIDQYVTLAQKKRDLAKEKLSIGELTFGEAFKSLSDGFKSLSQGAKNLGSLDLTKAAADFGATVGKSLTEVASKITIGDIASGIATALEGAADVIGGVLGGGFIQEAFNFIQGIAEFPKKLLEVFQNFDKIIGELADQLPGIIDKFLEALPRIADSIGEAIVKSTNTLADKLPQIITTLLSALDKILQRVLGEALPKIIESLPAVIKSILDALPGLIKTILGALPRIITAIFKAIPEIIKVIADALPDIILAIVDSLPDIVLSFVEGFLTAIPEIVDALITSFLVEGGLERLVVGIIKAIPKIALALVQGILRGLANGTVKSFQTLGKVFTSGFGNVFGKLGSSFGGDAGKSLLNPLNVFKKQLADIMRGKAFLDGLRNAFNNGALAFFSRVVGFFNGIRDTFNRAALNVFNSIRNAFTQGVATLYSTIVGAFTSVFGGLYSTITGAFTSIFGSLYSTITGAFTSIFQSLYDTIRNSFFSVFDGLRNVFSDGGNSLKNALFEPINSFRDFLNNFKFPEIGGVFGGGGGGGGGVVGQVTEALGFASGGTVPSGFPNDTFPARLTSGEMVIDPGDTQRLSRFLDTQQTPGGADVSSALLSQILAALQAPINVQTTAEVSGKALADILLQISRNNGRTSA